MKNKRLAEISDMASEVHTRIQHSFANIDPVIGLSQNMRANGIPADVITIDCLRSGKRIILILHDQEPDAISYLFSYRDQDPSTEFETIDFKNFTTEILYNWISGYFAIKSN